MTDTSLLDLLSNNNEFATRHNGPDSEQQKVMLETIGVDSLDQLIEETVPAAIRLPKKLQLGNAQSESEMLTSLKELASKNVCNRSYIGQGYYNTFTPNVVLRNVLENPGWYSAYTPYQPEISQGRLESLLNYQQMIMDLTAMEIANASLLDEATAAAEAMTLCKRAGKSKSNTFFVCDELHPQTIDVLHTRAEYIGFEIITGALDEMDKHDIFAAILQYPSTTGNVQDLTELISQAHSKNTLVAVATDLLALTLLKAPGEMGADVVIGSAQRFGVAMGFGGPHAAFMASKDKFKRTCRVALLAFLKIDEVIAPCAWQCKHANNISAVKKRPLTSVRHRHCLPIWRHFMQFIMVPQACVKLDGAYTT